MKTWLDFNDCLKDSPKFRAVLEEQEHSIHALESHLEKVRNVMTGFTVSVPVACMCWQ